MDNKTTVIIVSILAGLLVAGGAFYFVKDAQAKKAEAELEALFDKEVVLAKDKPAEATVSVDDLVLPDLLKGKKADFVDDFKNLDKWVEEEDFEFNKWAITTKGELQVKDGVLSRKSAGNSGLKLKDIEIKDAAIALKLRVTEMPESGAVGTRIQLRNAEDHWCYGYGLNTTTYSYELAAWHGKGNDKTAVLAPAAPEKQIGAEESWVTIVAIIQGNKLSYYKNGELIAESIDEEKAFNKGGVFISLTHLIEIDKVAIFNL
ncbi:MAG TPA: DUF1080 domain-containing protein [Firmicutes bacterium]|jgi:hypothetical protein|nr:DUF1080 domain-containing protein [Bacillota bacterium]